MVKREPRDDGVSPVVGMVLVLGISVVGIAAILYWGLPAIDEMKANVEHKSVESQFVELDASIKELVAGTTEKTAKRWQPTLNRGQVLVKNESEGWVYATEMYDATKDFSFVWDGFADGNSTFTIWNHGVAMTAANLTAYRVNSTTSGEVLKVDASPYDGSVDSMVAQGWTVGAKLEIRLYDSSDNEVPIKNATIRFRVYEDATKVAEAFFIPTGRIDYRLEAGLGTKTVSVNNGAVITGNGQSSTIINAPPIPPVSNTSGTSRFFARAVVLNGTGSFGGSDRFDVLVTLYTTSTLASYDCAKDDKSDCVESVKLFPVGDHAVTWRNYLANSGRGYTFSSEDDYGVKYLADREGWMGFTLLQSIVQLQSQG